MPGPERAGPGSPAAARARVLLFTGHRIDAPGREEPRFPPDKETLARAAIERAVRSEMAAPGGVRCGLAGAASGGDILFHEVCAQAGIPTRVYLALPREQYLAASVAPAGPGWVERFRAICARRPTRELAAADDPPDAGPGVWQRANLWMLEEALAAGAHRVTLVALWDGAGGDGPGGTADLVRTARQRGARTVIIDTSRLSEL